MRSSIRLLACSVLVALHPGAASYGQAVPATPCVSEAERHAFAVRAVHMRVLAGALLCGRPDFYATFMRVFAADLTDARQVVGGYWERVDPAAASRRINATEVGLANFWATRASTAADGRERACAAEFQALGSLLDAPLGLGLVVQADALSAEAAALIPPACAEDRMPALPADRSDRPAQGAAPQRN